MTELVFKTEVFEGPLDLLVYLVKSKKIDVREIPISVLADEFMAYMRRMEEIDIKLSSDFVATASHLMYLKSKALLPKGEKEKKEFEEEKEKLYEMIERYSKVKEIVEEVEKRGKLSRYPVRVDRAYGIFDESVEKAIRAAVRSVEIKEKVYRIKKEAITVEEMMERILKMELPLEVEEVLMEAKSKYELIVMLLAILELVRLGKLVYMNGRIDRG